MSYKFTLSLNGTVFITVATFENGLARCYWKGHTTGEMISEGSELIAHVVERFDVTHLLVDSSFEEGPWNGSIDWLINNWMPRVSALGLKKIAILLSQDTLNAMSATQYNGQAREHGFDTRLFRSEAKALHWLNNSTKHSVSNDSI